MSRSAAKTPEGTIGAAGLGSLDVALGTGTSAAASNQVRSRTSLAWRNSASCAATGGLTEEIAHDDGCWQNVGPAQPASQAARSSGTAILSASCPGCVDPGPLEPGIPQVGHEVDHGSGARGLTRPRPATGRRERLGDGPCSCLALPTFDDPVDQLRDALPGDGRDRARLAAELSL